MLRNKAKLEIVSRILGHSSVAIMLDVYRHIYDEEILKEVELHGRRATGSRCWSVPRATKTSRRRSSTYG